MNNKKLVLIFLLVVGFAAILLVALLGNRYVQTYRERQAERIIRTFMEAKSINIQSNTEDYKIFMRRIVWGEYPELTEFDSDFTENETELGYVLDYAWKYSGYEDLYGRYNEPDADEAKPPVNGSDK